MCYDQFSKPLSHIFLNLLLVWSKKASSIMRKHFNKGPVMTNENDENFESSTKY